MVSGREPELREQRRRRGDESRKELGGEPEALEEDDDCPATHVQDDEAERLALVDVPRVRRRGSVRRGGEGNDRVAIDAPNAPVEARARVPGDLHRGWILERDAAAASANARYGRRDGRRRPKWRHERDQALGRARGRRPPVADG